MTVKETLHIFLPIEAPSLTHKRYILRYSLNNFPFFKLDAPINSGKEYSSLLYI